MNASSVSSASVDSLVGALGAVDASFGAHVFRADAASSANEAVRKAALSPVRASALLTAGEFVAAFGAITEAVAAHAPAVIHVVASDEEGPGLRALAAGLDLGAAVVVGAALGEAAWTSLALHRAAQDAEMPFVHIVETRDHGELPAPRWGAGEAEAFLGAGPAHREPSLAPDPSRVRHFASRVPFALSGALRDAGERAGLSLGAIERMETSDAEEVIVTYGAAFEVACGLARRLRASNRRIGVLGLRALRPFPAADVLKAISRCRTVLVWEPLDVPLSASGPIAACVKGAFADALTWAPGFPGVGRIPPVVSALVAVPALARSESAMVDALHEMANGERARRTIVAEG